MLECERVMGQLKAVGTKNGGKDVPLAADVNKRPSAIEMTMRCLYIVLQFGTEGSFVVHPAGRESLNEEQASPQGEKWRRRKELSSFDPAFYTARFDPALCTS